MSPWLKGLALGLVLLLAAAAVWVIVSSQPEPSAAPAPAAAPREMRFYFGNLHSHVGQYSHEPGVPSSLTYDEAFDYAADASRGHLDFLAITIHNHEVDSEAYPRLREAVMRHDRPGSFAPIAGQEFSTISTGNHVNVFETDAWVDPREVASGDFRTLYERWLPAHRTAYTFAEFNHPDSSDFTGQEGREYGRDDYGGSLAALEQASAPWVRAIEVIKTHTTYEGRDFPHMNEDPRRLRAYYMALSAGWRLGPAANQDNHRLNHGSSAACRTVAVTPALTRQGVLEALLACRFYASEDWDLEITFRMGDYWMGSAVPLGQVQPLTVKVRDRDEPGATYTVRLLGGTVGGPPLQASTPPLQEFHLGDNQAANYSLADPKPGTYYLLAVRQTRTGLDPGPVQTEDDAWTAPVWIVAR